MQLARFVTDVKPMMLKLAPNHQGRSVTIINKL
jgi:hypothetical protein